MMGYKRLERDIRNCTHHGVQYYVELQKLREESTGNEFWIAYAKCQGDLAKGTCPVNLSTSKSDYGRFRSMDWAAQDVSQKLEGHIDNKDNKHKSSR